MYGMHVFIFCLGVVSGKENEFFASPVCNVSVYLFGKK